MRTTAFLLAVTILVPTAGCPVMASKYSPFRNRGESPPLNTILPSQGLATWAHGGGDATKTPKPPPKGVAKAEPLPHLSVIDPRKVVYTAELSIVSANVRTALEQTKALARQIGGYMQQMTSTSIVIRVPAEKFDQAIAAMEKLGTVMHRNIKASDVTEDYIDLEIRLKNAEALLAKLLALLDKAADVKDALAVEKELARVRTQVEQLTGQLNRLKNQVVYATISARFVAAHEAPDELKVTLPFWWLRSLGLEGLLRF